MRIIVGLSVGLGLVAISLALLFSGSALAGSESLSCTVPGDYAQIQAAVDDPGCAEVILGKGTFYETVTITRTIDIRGQGPNSTKVDGFASGSVFYIDGSSSPTIDVTLEGLNIVNGSSSQGGGLYSIEATLVLTGSLVSGNWAKNQGGGIYGVQGELNIANSVIDNNRTAGGSGGGVFLGSGASSIENSIIKRNEADGPGGGLYVQDSNVNLNEVSVADNTSHFDGGGIFNKGAITINNASIHDNRSVHYSGGGIRNEGTAYVNNATISNNKSGWDEAGIDNQGGILRLSSSTIANNTGRDGGGLSGRQGSDVRVQNSIVSGNSPNDCRGTIRSDGYNVIDNTSRCDYRAGTGDMVGMAANLGPLEGEPGYHPLLIGPGIDTGNPGGCRNYLGQLLATDQRGAPRVGRCDSGSYEFQGEIYQVSLPLCFNNLCPDFLDDFSDTRSGWPSGEDSHVRYGYYGGEYQIFSKLSGYFYLYDAPTCWLENYTVEVDARWEGSPGSGYGIVFGISGDFDQFYLFDINTDYQMFRLLYLSPTGWEVLVYPESSGAIHAGNAGNQLAVERNGTKIALAVNGTTLRTVYDSRSSGTTRAGIVSSPYGDQAKSDARFDNFSMVELTGASDASAELKVFAGSGIQGSSGMDLIRVPGEFDWPAD